MSIFEEAKEDCSNRERMTSQKNCRLTHLDRLDITIQHRPISSASTADVAHMSIQTPLVLSSKLPLKTVMKKKIHSLQVLVSRLKKRLDLVKIHLFLLRKQYCSRNVVADSIESIVKAASKFIVKKVKVLVSDA